MRACTSCRVKQCTEANDPCLCVCHDSEYEAGFDEQEDDDAEA